MAEQKGSNGSRKKSTTVRAPWHLRTGFALAERFAPGPAAKLLSERWFRVPGGPERRLRGRAPADAQVFTVDCQGSEVWGWDRGEGPLVYAVHGWGGCTGDLDYLSASLVASGMRVVAFDAPSHGNSGPGTWGERYSHGPQMVDAMRTVLQKFGPPEAIVAHSMGAIIAVLAMRAEGLDLTETRLVLAAPFVGGTAGFSETMNAVVPVGPRIMERFIPLAEARVGVELSTIAIADPPVEAPTLIVHDRRDRPNPFRHSEELAETWPNAELVATEGLGHRKILSNPAVIERVTAFAKGE